MIWQFTGVGPHNKGAELMFLAMQEKVRELDPQARIAMVPGEVGDYEWRSRQGLWQVLDPARSGRLGWLRDRLFHSGYRERFGIVHQCEVDIVLDASGFALGDQWPVEWIEGTATYYERLRRQGTKIVILPQAFGPFLDIRIRDASRRILNSANLVFARDSESLEYVRALSPGLEDRIRQAPDFTNLIKGRLPSDWIAQPDRDVAVIPNRKMLEKAVESISDHYQASMAGAMKQIHQSGLRPFVLIHEINDRKLGEQIASLAGLPEAVVELGDPLELKGILGTCAYSIGSRFHGLISCLSQGVPAIGTSWSHKYRHLFKDYATEDLLVHSPEEFDRGLSRLASETERSRISAGLRQAALAQCGEAEKMWSEVSLPLSA